MQMYIGVLSPIITMVLLYYYQKSEKARKLRALLNKLFWVDELAVNRALSFSARFTLIFYLFYIVNFTIYGIIGMDFDALMWIALFAVGVPAVFRLIMSIQRMIFKL